MTAACSRPMDGMVGRVENRKKRCLNSDNSNETMLSYGDDDSLCGEFGAQMMMVI